MQFIYAAATENVTVFTDFHTLYYPIKRVVGMKEQLIVRGGRKLGGDLHVSAAKNSVLPLIACCIMSDKELHIRNCPALADIFSMIEIIKGC